MEQQLFVRRVAERLKAAERQTDLNMAAIAELIREMTAERADAGLAAHAGHKALINCVSALGQLSQTRSRLILAHDRLAADAESLQLPLTAIGPFEQKPERPTGRFEDAAAA
ncbi:MAG: hypothetical protein ACK4Z5_07175 [Brevundimonas sp.]